jgi:hypothetical protein
VQLIEVGLETSEVLHVVRFSEIDPACLAPGAAITATDDVDCWLS